jgi:hypothetical protein
MAAVGLAAALAAAVAVMVWPAKQPVVQPRKPAVMAVVPAAQNAPSRSRLREKATIRGAPVRKRSGDVEYYLALDDEPIESGVVVQVTLPDTGLLAEVIYDEYGRPRAVRPLN